ncbi:glycosyltransferase family 9 protein [Desulfonatronum parangueonense]
MQAARCIKTLRRALNRQALDQTRFIMNRYLVIQLARFGDIVQTKRLIRGLCADQENEVHLAVDAGLADLAGLLYPDVRIHGLPVHGSRFDPHVLLRTCRTIFADWKGADFHRVFNCNHGGCNHVLAGLFAPEQVIGYHWHHGQTLRGPWPETVFRLSANRLANPLNLMDYWGHFLQPALAPELVNPPARPRGGGLGVVMAGRHARRSLPIPVLGRLVQAAAAGSDGPIHLLGTQVEHSAARQLRNHLSTTTQSRLKDLTGKTNWAALCDVVQGLDLLLTPDTGTMHLAAHLGIPVTAFFLSSAWCFETGPYGEGHHVWQAVESCAPCLESENCPRATACIQPFADKAVLARLSGDDRRPLPEALCLLRTGLDDFGVEFNILAGELPEQGPRLGRRELLRSHCLRMPPRNPALEQESAFALYHETDWMIDKT